MWGTQRLRRLPLRRWCSTAAHAARVAALHAEGAVLMDECAEAAVVEAARGRVLELFDECMDAVRERQNGAELNLGTNYGWREVVQRAKGRYDMTYRLAEVPEVAAVEATFAEFVRSVFAERGGYEKVGQGVLIASEGAAEHPYHIDGPHLYPPSAAPHLPPHAVNLFVPLVDVTAENGATQFLLRSHADTNVPPGQGFADLLSDASRYPVWCTAGVLARGRGVVFDYRVLHRAAPHVGGAPRPVLYFTYATPWFRDIYNFPERSLHTPMAALC